MGLVNFSSSCRARAVFTYRERRQPKIVPENVMKLFWKCPGNVLEFHSIKFVGTMFYRYRYRGLLQEKTMHACFPLLTQRKRQTLTLSIHSFIFIQTTTVAPLQVRYYSEALQTSGGDLAPSLGGRKIFSR